MPLMNRTVFFGALVAVVFVSSAIGYTYTENITQTAEAAKPSGLSERVSVTVHFAGAIPGGDEPAATVLLDTTGSGTLKDVHVAATLPCDTSTSAPSAGIVVLAGVAPELGVLLITSGEENTGIAGPGVLCVFHGSSIGNEPGTITDVVLSTPSGTTPGVTITITGTYN